MRTLKELVDYYKDVPNVTDDYIISQYYRLNHKEEDAIRMMADLSAAKIHDYQWKFGYANSWATCVPTASIMAEYGDDMAPHLIDFIHFVILNSKEGGFLDRRERFDEEVEIPSGLLAWLKENVPKLHKPKGAFFQPALWALKEIGIYFKDEETRE